MITLGLPMSLELNPATLLKLWRKLYLVPGGRTLFSRALGVAVPYTGSIKPLIRSLEPGYAKVSMRDQRSVRNHLKSVHAVALMNLAEVTSGLALLVATPKNYHGIITGFEMKYLKKGRGTLTAECHCEIPKFEGKIEHDVDVTIFNEKREVVARGIAHWLLSPKGRLKA